MQKYNITGMSCAACQARVEKAVSKVKGVSECSVSLLTNSMGVEGSADSSEIIKAVENAGYGASLIGKPASNSASDSAGTSAIKSESDSLLENKETPLLIKRLISSALFLLILMYVSMGHMMWNWPLPSWFNGNHVAMGLLQMILAAIILVINKKFFISGFKSLIHGAPNMDTLVAMGSGVSFLYSVFMLFGMTDAVLKGDEVRVMHFMDSFYFESAAMILTLITVGKLLESISKGKTTNALKSLMKLAPKKAVIIRDGVETEVDIERVQVGDIFVVYPGQNLPVDGVIIEGQTSINESSLTGESIPLDKKPGDSVYSGTANINGYIKCRAERVGQDTTISQIIQMVSDAAATKAPIAKIADKVSGVFVPAVIIIAAITFALWLIFGAELSFALSRAIAVLVVSCPCALGLATPVAIMVGNGVGAKNGILFKTSASLENAGKTQIVALDKTGTITKGEPEVVDFDSSLGLGDEKALLQVAYNLEVKSEHPLAKAIVKYAEDKGINGEELDNFEIVSGKGVKGSRHVDNKIVEYFGGNLTFILENCLDIQQNQPDLLEAIKVSIDKISKKGQTPLLFASQASLASPHSTFLGIIAVADTIKPESPEAIAELKNMGIKVVMLTGDNNLTARAIAEKVGLDEVVANILPAGKEAEIKKLKQKGKVCMVGDGVNDAPALTSADIGIAIGAGADVAIDAADLVLVKNRLNDVSAAIRLSRKTLTNIHENLFWAFFYNIVLIPIAAGAYYHAFGLEMNPMLGAAAMSLSSFCVVTNALRLNLVNIRKSGKNIFRRKNKSQEADMAEIEKTLKVEGMMCNHCEMHVKEALEKIKGVESASADHTSGEVKVILSKEVKDKDFEKAITKAGYKFISA